MLLLSPVDGVDPFGLVPTFCISPPQPLHFRSSSSKSLSRFRSSSSSSLQLHHRRTPTLIIAGGLDSVPGIDVGGLMPACAPQVMMMMMMMMLHRLIILTRTIIFTDRKATVISCTFFTIVRRQAIYESVM